MKKFFEKAAEHFTPLRIVTVLIALIAIALDHVTGFATTYVMAMALAADRDTPEIQGKLFSYPVLGTTKIYAGGIVVLDSSGYAKPAVTATGLVAVGRAEDTVDNLLGNSGDLDVTVREGIFRYGNSSATDLITIAEIGDTCFLVDDETVAKTSATNTRSVAGYIRQVDSDGVWVEFRNTLSADGDVVAANNLSDVTAGTARSNIGANKVVLTVLASSLVGSAATIYGVVSPVAGTISRIDAVLKGHALATGNATLTGKIGGTPITTGLLTITQAGSAIGDKVSCSPSAAKTVAAGDEIQFLLGGTNDNAAAFAEISVLILT
jgi:hypothetical protein